MVQKIVGLVLAVCLLGVAVGQEVPETVFSKWKDRVDPSVERALQYLASVQNKEGSFPENYGDSTGIPALVGMAFLSKGHMATEGPYAENINRCVDFIVSHQNREGLFVAGHAGSGPMYAHNISTLFLSEVSGMVDPERQAKIAKTLPKALQLILRAQNVEKPEQHRGGWRYHPGSRDSDTSCSGWALMALRSAKLNGAAVPDKAISDAVEYLYRHYDEKQGCFGYSNRDSHKYSLTGMGLLCLELCGEHGKPATVKAGDFVLKHHQQLANNQFEFYGNYYNAQGMFQLGGKYWETYANHMYDSYLPKQQEDGSWHSREAGRVYGTSMMVLAFSVPYRQLPIYQRDERVDEE
ncbi:MAG: terpene cyclase/mutase family protein [Akkermansiaceae bacterium]|nr:terpene cyclase/mutase family protein [Akkermansiaceae bacterium]